MITRFRRIVASLLIVSLTGIGLPLPAQAGMVATDAVVAAGQRERLAGMVNRADVQAQLQAYGVDPVDVKARVAAMTDQEVAQLAGQVDSLPAGGDGIIGAIVFIFLILLVTDILGLTKIFPFTRSIR